MGIQCNHINEIVECVSVEKEQVQRLGPGALVLVLLSSVCSDPGDEHAQAFYKEQNDR